MDNNANTSRVRMTPQEIFDYIDMKYFTFDSERGCQYMTTLSSKKIAYIDHNLNFNIHPNLCNIDSPKLENLVQMDRFSTRLKNIYQYKIYYETIRKELSEELYELDIYYKWTVKNRNF